MSPKCVEILKCVKNVWAWKALISILKLQAQYQQPQIQAWHIKSENHHMHTEKEFCKL